MKKKMKKSKKTVPATNVSPSVFQGLEKRLVEMEKRFEHLFSDNWLQPSKWDFPEWTHLSTIEELRIPKVDIVDQDDDILVRADIPGVKKEDLDVTLTDNTITLKGCTIKEKEEKNGDYYRSETMKRSFSRVMPLPSEVDGSKAKSTFKDGVLEVVVPKLEKARRHSVKIS